jgi:hypothetical protein
MKRLEIFFLYLIVGLISCGMNINRTEKIESGEIKISWKNNISGDFSFKENWEYPEGIYKNDFGQLSCDGLCPSEIDRMVDENGRIYNDSLVVFYQKVDTSHQFHSIQSDAWCYEWAGTNFATAKKLNNDTIICFTKNNSATHCSLNLILTNNKCIPTIKLNSIVNSTGIKTYTCKSGQIEIDKKLWDKGIIKSKFEFIFDHKENPNKPMFWKGKIYAEIKIEK